ncbi:MAG TPA: PA2169 family four-helix-bundle protein [Vicinamibacterales bacterium]|nr:PA2169 family four-helix-bundle protein [Vicinamibacterales bacterium]
MQQSNATTIVNDLIQTCRDAEEGFKAAAGAVKDAHIRSLFERYSRQRAEMARELEDEVRKLGGTPETGGSLSGSFHRGWMNIKAAVTGLDDSAIIAEAERGEDSTKAAYQKALEENLPAGVRRLIEDQADIVRLAHDEVRTLEKTHAH